MATESGVLIAPVLLERDAEIATSMRQKLLLHNPSVVLVTAFPLVEQSEPEYRIFQLLAVNEAAGLNVHIVGD